jgi:DUF1365 family protein
VSVPASQPRIGIGSVRHHRLRPVEHRLHYPAWFLLLPMRQLRAEPCALLHRNQRRLVSFHDADHGLGGHDCLAWVEALLVDEGIADVDGEIWLQTMPRVFGHVFKPASFWYCHRADGSLRAVVVEVNNTFGERHCYVLDGPGLRWGREQRARKVFHVSPFCEVRGTYRFRFVRTDLDDRPHGCALVRIDHEDDAGLLLSTSLAGALQPLTAAGLRRALVHMPLAVPGVLLRIHWHALQLWLKGVPWFTKPPAPKTATTR